MKVQLHLDEQGMLVITDPARIRAQLESQPVSRLIRTLEGVINALYSDENAEWHSNTPELVAAALDEVVETA